MLSSTYNVHRGCTQKKKRNKNKQSPALRNWIQLKLISVCVCVSVRYCQTHLLIWNLNDKFANETQPKIENHLETVCKNFSTTRQTSDNSTSASHRWMNAFVLSYNELTNCEWHYEWMLIRFRTWSLRFALHSALHTVFIVQIPTHLGFENQVNSLYYFKSSTLRPRTCDYQSQMWSTAHE